MKNSKMLMVVFGILTIGMVGMSSTVFAQETVSSANLGVICGITVDGALDYGNIDVDAESSEGTIVIFGDGSGTQEVEVSASNWLDDTDGVTNIINGELTKFATTDQGALTDYTTEKIALNSTDTTILMGTVSSGSTNSTYWQVFATLNDETFSGGVTQILTFTSIGCV